MYIRYDYYYMHIAMYRIPGNIVLCKFHGFHGYLSYREILSCENLGLMSIIKGQVTQQENACDVYSP